MRALHIRSVTFYHMLDSAASHAAKFPSVWRDAPPFDRNEGCVYLFNDSYSSFWCLL